MGAKNSITKILTVALAGIAVLALAVMAQAQETPAASAASVAKVETPAAPQTKTTLEDLQAAYNGESNAHAKYLAYALKADQEGYGKVASLFRTAAQAEQIHLTRHAKVIKSLGGRAIATVEVPDVKTTKENLEDSVKGETYENKTMYPEFLAQAEKEKIADAVDAFEDAMAAEGVHASLYAKALKELESWKVPAVPFYLCPKCGNVLEDLTLKACPICDTDTKKFITVS